MFKMQKVESRKFQAICTSDLHLWFQVLQLPSVLSRWHQEMPKGMRQDCRYVLHLKCKTVVKRNGEGHLPRVRCVDRQTNSDSNLC